MTGLTDCDIRATGEFPEEFCNFLQESEESQSNVEEDPSVASGSACTHSGKNAADADTWVRHDNDAYCLECCHPPGTRDVTEGGFQEGGIGFGDCVGKYTSVRDSCCDEFSDAYCVNCTPFKNSSTTCYYAPVGARTQAAIKSARKVVWNDMVGVFFGKISASSVLEQGR